MSADSGNRRFVCTQCGKCCNRSPEVELSEAAALSDLFVFRLMFRMYRMARAPEPGSGSELFYQKKRLLAAHAARRSPTKIVRGGKAVEGTNYLVISALALDTSPGSCAALHSNRCSVHDRRPLTCRTVPFHYSRADGLATSDFDAFVATPGYRCDTADTAGSFLEQGRVVDTATVRARADALELAAGDRPWKEAIVRRMKPGGDGSMPSFHEVEANAGISALTTSMRVAWQVAADAGLIGRQACQALIEQQLTTIEREVQRGAAVGEDRQTLHEMRTEYLKALQPAAVGY